MVAMSPAGTLPKRYPIQNGKSNTSVGANSHKLGHNATRTAHLSPLHPSSAHTSSPPLSSNPWIARGIGLAASEVG